MYFILYTTNLVNTFGSFGSAYVCDRSSRPRTFRGCCLSIMTRDSWTFAYSISIQCLHFRIACTCLSTCGNALPETTFPAKEVIFRLKPSVPAVSRWTTCGKSARYFLLPGVSTCCVRSFLYFFCFKNISLSLSLKSKFKTSVSMFVCQDACADLVWVFSSWLSIP